MAGDFPSMVLEMLSEELPFGGIAGLFMEPLVPNLRVSPLEVVPKKEPNKFWLIHHLSFPKGCTANYSIDPELCSVVYTSLVDTGVWSNGIIGKRQQ